jgi:ABC-type transport system substrate-binding protein
VIPRNARRGVSPGSPGPGRPGDCRRERRLRSRLGLAVVGALLVLTGCTPPGLPPPQSPSQESSAPSTVPPGSQVVIGVDGAVTGFNPHAIADFSPAARAVASLILPSTTVVRADGSTWFDPAIVAAAALTSADPYTVTYTLNQAAAWSDGTPVTAEDFTYLWQQMLVQPGTVDPAGYRLITAIRSRDAGKTVEIQFSGPFPAWPSLFSPLLPAHILKDAPGGWTGGLDNGIPVSANRYKLSSYDRVTGQITMVANDKFWASTPGPATVVLRIGSPSELLAALRRGDLQALFARPDSTETSAIDLAVPLDRRTDVPLPATTQLVLNTTAGPTKAVAVRRAIATALDYPTLRETAAGGRVGGVLPVSSQVSLPSTGEGTGTSAPPLAITDDADAAREVLADAGYRVDGLYARTGDGVLRLTLGVATDDPRSLSTARAVQRQLGRAGILVDLTLYPLGPLVTGRVAQGQLDLALLTVPRSRSDTVAAASAFGCPATAAGDAAARTGNLSGYCQTDVQQGLDAALAGHGDLSTVNDRIWSDLPVIPVGQPTAIFAVGPSLSGALEQAGPGWLWTGPLPSVAG